MKTKSKKVKVEDTSVNIFYNTVTKVMLFCDAHHFDGAERKFDLCGFKHRSDWKILLECTWQPTEGKNAK